MSQLASFLERIMVINICLIVFNLIPATADEFLVRSWRPSQGHPDFPGQGLAFVFGFIGLLTHFLAFIALFVWIGAAQEASAAQVKSAFAGTPIRAAMLTDFQMLGPSGTLAGAVNLILQGWQQDFPAVEQSGAIGILTPTDLLVVLPQHRRIVTSIMRRDFLTVDRAEMLETVPAPGRMRLSYCACPTNDPKALAPNGVPRHSAA